MINITYNTHFINHLLMTRQKYICTACGQDTRCKYDLLQFLNEKKKHPLDEFNNIVTTVTINPPDYVTPPCFVFIQIIKRFITRKFNRVMITVIIITQ